MNDVKVKDEESIENLIYEIREKQVMLDSDLAKLYECANGTKSINLAVNRNIERFPVDLCFSLQKKNVKCFQGFNLKPWLKEGIILNIYLMFLLNRELLCLQQYLEQK